MASYDNTTDIHTMTIYEAANYLNGLPKNTKETPYKVNITGVDLNENGLYSTIIRLKYLMMWPQYGSSLKSGERFLDLTATEIIIPPNCNKSVLFYECYFLVKSPKFILNTNDSRDVFKKIFYECKNLIAAPVIPYGVTNMESAFEGCGSLTTSPEIPNSVTNMHLCFAGCTKLTTTPYIPNSVTNMDAAFNNCVNLKTVTNIPNSVTNMNATFNNCVNLTTVYLTGCTVNFSNIIKTACFRNCPKLKEFIYNVEYKENDWTLYLLKRIGNNLNIKRYSIETNTLIDEHTISLDNATNELDLFSKSDELLIDSIGNITDQQIDLLLKTKHPDLF